MKLPVAWLSLLACTISTAFAFLEETEAELQGRYGEPKEITRAGGDPLRTHTFKYEHDGYKIRVTLFDGKSQLESYRHLDKERLFTHEEIQSLLAGNSHGKPWTIMPNRTWLLGDKSAPMAFADSLPSEKSAEWAVYTTAYSKLDGIAPRASYTGKEEFRSGVASIRQVDQGRLLTLHNGRAVIEIPLTDAPYSELAHVETGKMYRITLIDREAEIPETSLAFVTDREHKTWHDIVVDSIAKPLVRIEEGKNVLFDRSVCELHHVAMKRQQVDISYGLYGAPTEAEAFCDTYFPHHRDFALGGCVLSDNSPKLALIYICPQCVADCEKHKRAAMDGEKRKKVEVR